MTAPGQLPGRAPDETGAAVVEFLGATLVLLVPLVYLVLVLAQLQAAAFAVDGAAREAARTIATSPGDEALARAQTSIAVALADQGIDPDLAADALEVACEERTCAEPGSTVTAAVEVDVPLLGVPDGFAGTVGLTVAVSGTATATLDRFRER